MKIIVQLPTIDNEVPRPCECESQLCVHPSNDAPCVYFATHLVYFPAFGTFALCDACIANYQFHFERGY